MKRQTLTDGSGRWFDIDKAERFDEELRWDGNHHVSIVTGSPWDHEVLYRTAGGRWIIHRWSQWQGVADTWGEIDDAAAARWLAINGYDPHPACAAEYAALEVG